MKRMLITAALLAVSFALQAKEQGGGKDPMAVCRADFDKFCKDVKPGEGRQMQCMMDNKSRLSGDCQTLMSKKQEQQAQWQKNKAKRPQ